MDPNATLREMCQIIQTSDDVLDLYAVERVKQDFARLVELISSLDEWIVKGGSLPDRWNLDLPIQLRR